MRILFPIINSTVYVDSNALEGVSVVLLLVRFIPKNASDRFILIPCLFDQNDQCGLGWEEVR